MDPRAMWKEAQTHLSTLCRYWGAAESGWGSQQHATSIMPFASSTPNTGSFLRDAKLVDGCTPRIVQEITPSPELLNKAGQISYEDFVKPWMPEVRPGKRAHVLTLRYSVFKSSVKPRVSKSGL